MKILAKMKEKSVLKKACFGLREDATFIEEQTKGKKTIPWKEIFNKGKAKKLLNEFIPITSSNSLKSSYYNTIIKAFIVKITFSLDSSYSKLSKLKLPQRRASPYISDSRKEQIVTPELKLDFNNGLL